jgi:hypothetical protein
MHGKKYVLFCYTQQTHNILPLPPAECYGKCMKHNINLSQNNIYLYQRTLVDPILHTDHMINSEYMWMTAVNVWDDKSTKL